MATAPSAEDYLGIGLAAMPQARPKLLLDTGDISEQTVAAGAAMADAVSQYVASSVRETFLDGADGDKLDARVQDRWNLPRLAASNSLVTLSFSRAAFTAGAGTIPAGTRFATPTDSEGGRREFVTTGAASFGATDLGPKTAAAESVQAGAAANCDASTITQIPDSLFDTSITATNVARASGGADVETDPEYRARARAYPQTLAKGTLAALEFGAGQVAGVRRATAVEDAAGVVTVYIADAAGGSNPSLVALVVTELENWRAAGALVLVTGGVTQLVDVEVTLVVAEGQATDYTSQIQSAITAEILLLGAGATLYHSRLEATCIAVDRNNILDAVISVPAGNVVPTNSFNLLRAGGITVLQG